MWFNLNSEDAVDELALNTESRSIEKGIFCFRYSVRLMKDTASSKQHHTATFNSDFRFKDEAAERMIGGRSILFQKSFEGESRRFLSAFHQ